jgi:hypothetical protein
LIIVRRYFLAGGNVVDHSCHIINTLYSQVA